MKTINATARANGILAYELDGSRGHSLHSVFKRQSRRQVRHRLASELRINMGHHLAEAMEMMSVAGIAGMRKPAAPQATAVIIAFPSQEQRAARSVLVVRKLARSPFERKQVQVELLAA